MKKLLAIALVTLGLAGCGGEAGSAEQSTTGWTPELAATAIRDEYPKYATLSDEQVLSPLYKTCQGFDAGLTWLEAVAVFTDAGRTGEEAGYLIGIAVHALCPQHRGLLPSP